MDTEEIETNVDSESRFYKYYANKDLGYSKDDFNKFMIKTGNMKFYKRTKNDTT